MFGSGVAIGMAHTAHQAKPTHRVQIQVAAAFCVVVVGTATRASVVLRFVATSIRRSRAAFTASVLFVSLSLRKIAICYNEQVKSKRPASKANGPKI